MLEINTSVFYALLFLGFLLTFISSLAVYFRSRSLVPRIFAAFLMSASIWVLLAFFETFSIEDEWKKIIFNIKYIFVVLTPVLFLMFSFEYRGTTRKGRMILHATLSVVMVIILSLVWTDQFHGLVFKDIGVEEIQNIQFIIFERGILHYSIDAVLIGILMAGILLFIRRWKTGVADERKHIVVILATVLIPFSGAMLEITEVSYFGYIDAAPFLFIFSAIIIDISLINMDLFYFRTMSREMMIDHISEGLVSLDRNGKVLDINERAREILDLEDRPFREMEMDRVHGRLNELINEIGGMETDHIESELGRGGKIYDIKTSSITDRSGRKLGTLVLIQNISKRRRYQKDLEEKKEELDRYNEVLSFVNKVLRHDLMNDLMVIRMSKGAFERTGESKVLDKMDASLDRSISLIKRMRELESSMGQEKGLRPMNIAQMLKDYGSRMELKVDVDGDHKVLADDALHSLVLNLLTNARKHGGADRLRVSIEGKDDIVKVDVCDNGSGIAPNMKERIFDEGFSLGRMRGSGLGLYIVRRTMKRYGGDVSVKDSDSGGTCFQLRFRQH